MLHLRRLSQLHDNWNQIKLYVNRRTLYEHEIKSIESFFRSFIRLNNLSKRYFYLYELIWDGIPHVFFAFESNKKHFKVPKLPSIADTYKFVYKSKDYKNGDSFLNLMHQTTLAHLKGDLLYQQPQRRKGLLAIHHFMHCMSNMITGDRISELNFYTKQYEFYSGKTISILWSHVLLDLLKSFRRLFIRR